MCTFWKTFNLLFFHPCLNFFHKKIVFIISLLYYFYSMCKVNVNITQQRAARKWVPGLYTQKNLKFKKSAAIYCSVLFLHAHSLAFPTYKMKDPLVSISVKLFSILTVAAASWNVILRDLVLQFFNLNHFQKNSIGA